MREFLVLRHGQSLGDINGRHEGRADFPLTALGRAQAVAAARWIAAHYPPATITASPLLRAAETAQIVAAVCGLEITYDDELMEFDNGAIAGLTFAEAEARYPAAMHGRLPHVPMPGGESDIAFAARGEALWSRLRTTFPEGERHLLVAHGGIINRLFRSFLGLPPGTGARLLTGDTGIHLWQAEGATRRVVFANASAHLPPADG